MVAALLLALSSAPNTIELVRGAEIRPGYQYWSVEDTTLDSAGGSENLGASLSLLGGPSRTILIKFGDLQRAIGAGKKVKSAKLVLTPLSEKPSLRSADRVLSAWSEGPLRPLLAHAAVPIVAGFATWQSRRTGVPTIGWQQPGASGPSDAEPIAGATATATETEFTVDGLGPAIERQRERWYDNNGLALRFNEPAEFYSSQAPVGRPKLEIEVEDATPATGADLSVTEIEATGQGDRTYTAHVKNLGNAPADGFSAAWIVDGKSGASVDRLATLAPGQEATVTFTKPFQANDTDHRIQPLGLKIVPRGTDASPTNDYLEIQESGFPIDLSVPSGAEDWAQSVVRLWNDVYSTQSRYSFAPDGSRERVRINRFAADAPMVVTKEQVGDDRMLLRRIGLALGLADLSRMQVPAGSGRVAIPYGSVDPYAGLMGGGDTRYDGAVVSSQWLPNEPRPFESFDAIPTDTTGLLSMTDVATLNANLGKPKEERKPFVGMPAGVIIRATDLGLVPIAGTELNVFRSQNGKTDLGAPAFTVTTTDQGIAVLPRPNGGIFGDLSTDVGNGVLLIRAQKNGATAWGWLKAWQLADAFARGNSAAAIVEMPFNLPGAALEPGTNLAANRVVSDSANTPAGTLAALVGDSADKPVALPAGKDSWVEIDLGRDRTIGEIQLMALTTEMWPRFDIVLYATGQTVANATTLYQERDWSYAAQNRSETLDPVRTVLYRSTGDRFRFLRLVNRSGQAGALRSIRVVAAKTAGS